MGTDVAKFIHDLGMSPRELADELGLTRGQISRLIVGEEKANRVIELALVGLRTARLESSVKKAPATPKVAPKNPLAKELSDDKWTGQTARLALPILIEIAENPDRQPVTYGQLHELVVARGGKPNIGTMTKYATPLGKIASAMDRLKLPPLTTIVVSRSTGLPSPGIDQFIVRYLDLDREREKALREDLAVRRALVKPLWEEVFAYKRWHAVMAELGLTGNPIYDL